MMTVKLTIGALMLASMAATAGGPFHAPVDQPDLQQWDGQKISAVMLRCRAYAHMNSSRSASNASSYSSAQRMGLGALLGPGQSPARAEAAAKDARAAERRYFDLAVTALMSERGLARDAAVAAARKDAGNYPRTPGATRLCEAAATVIEAQ